MLRVEGLRVAIKGLVILRQVTLDVPPGEVVGLAGRNGAGKTTTLKSIMGILPAAGGAVSLDGASLLGVPGHRRAALGIGYMPEDRRLIGSLTVEDNILMPAWAGRLATAGERLAYVYRVIPPLAAMADRRASALSGGQQKLVALARAIMTGTRVLLLDEPFEGLAPAMGEGLAESIARVRQDGASVLIAESDVNRIGFAGRVYTIERGEIVQAGSRGGPAEDSTPV